jgi:hypothetical protein
LRATVRRQRQFGLTAKAQRGDAVDMTMPRQNDFGHCRRLAHSNALR